MPMTLQLLPSDRADMAIASSGPRMMGFIVAERLGPIDILVANAGASSPSWGPLGRTGETPARRSRQIRDDQECQQHQRHE